jgi:hypothetical protein
MNFKNIIFSSLLLLSFSCRETASEDHGHEHGTEDGERAHDEEAEHAHPHEDHTEQEEFTVGKDSIDHEEDAGHHSHEDGRKHDDH